jgi:hypothetical protein
MSHGWLNCLNFFPLAYKDEFSYYCRRILNLKVLGLAQFTTYLTFFKINNGIVPKQIFSATLSPFLYKAAKLRTCPTKHFFFLL